MYGFEPRWSFAALDQLVASSRSQREGYGFEPRTRYATLPDMEWFGKTRSGVILVWYGHAKKFSATCQ